MEDWVLRAMARWPDVPALFGWLSLDRRGRWLIKGEVITRPQIIDTINRNYAADQYGRWYFQNGPQRGYIRLDYAPLVFSVADDGRTLLAHTGARVAWLSAVYLDEEGSILLKTEHGLGLLADADLDWALQRLDSVDGALDEEQLAAALELPSGTVTALSLHMGPAQLPLLRLDAALAPTELGFVRDPVPRHDEKWAS